MEWTMEPKADGWEIGEMKARKGWLPSPRPAYGHELMARTKNKTASVALRLLRCTTLFWIFFAPGAFSPLPTLSSGRGGIAIGFPTGRAGNGRLDLVFESAVTK